MLFPQSTYKPRNFFGCIRRADAFNQRNQRAPDDGSVGKFRNSLDVRRV
jgi:hypothetical protein